MMLCDGHRNKHLGQIIDRRAKVAIVSGTGTGFAVNTPWLSWLTINCEVLCGRTRGGGICTRTRIHPQPRCVPVTSFPLSKGR